jgi:gluconolactonase
MNTSLILLAAACMAAVSVSAESVIAPGATLQKLAGDFKFTEGPTCDKNGNVFFVDQDNNRIMEWSADGKLSTFMQPSQYANGMMFDANGNLIACADEHNQLWSIAPDKTVTVLITNYQGKYMNGPNDVWIAPNGAMFITDPLFPRRWWTNQVTRVSSQEVYYLSPDRKTLTRVTEDLRQPNGITGTPDGKNLFVADMGANQTWRYDIQPDGSLTNKTPVCRASSDGMTIDDQGNLYLTGRGVTVFDKTGKQIDHIDVPENWTANVCFSGKDRKTLFITASKGFYSIDCLYKGANPSK